MSTQPEALRLAEWIESDMTCDGDAHIAAELRRLHAENERLCQINQSHEMKLSVRGYEIQIADLEAQRDALLKVVQIVDAHYSGSLDYRPSYVQLARAAIKAVEEGK